VSLFVDVDKSRVVQHLPGANPTKHFTAVIYGFP
jgi:hypothetical protein